MITAGPRARAMIHNQVELVVHSDPPSHVEVDANICAMIKTPIPTQSGKNMLPYQRAGRKALKNAPTYKSPMPKHKLTAELVIQVL